MNEQLIGFAAHEVRTDQPTRAARLKWVIMINPDLPTGRIANAAACVAAATAPAVTGLIAHGGVDASGTPHSGLPWSGCAILAADELKLQRVRDKAVRRDEIFVADMPIAAQETRVYDGFLKELATMESEEVVYAAVSLVGPQKVVARLVGGLALLP